MLAFAEYDIKRSGLGEPLSHFSVVSNSASSLTGKGRTDLTAGWLFAG